MTVKTKNIIWMFISIVMIAFSIGLSGCGTDSGNPGIATPIFAQPGFETTSGDFIGYRLCKKIISCYSNAPGTCSSLILSATNVTGALGISSTTYPLLSDAIAGVKASALVTTYSNMVSCHQALDALSCSNSLVVQAFDPTNPNDLSQAYRMLSASSTCSQMVAPK